MSKIQLQVSSPYDAPLHLTSAISVASRVWARNDIGTATIFVPRSDPKFSTIIEWGNLLRLNQLGLPSWVGVAVTREWSPQGVTLGCKSAEWLLGKKLSGQGKVYGAGSPVTVGHVANDLFTSAALYNNRIRNLKPGVFDASVHVFRKYDYADLLEAYRKLADDTGTEFWVDAGLRVHFRNTRGRNLVAGNSLVVLREGKHLVDVALSESAEEVITAAMALGNGSEIVARPKKSAQTSNPDFFRAEVLNVSGAASPEALEAPLYEHLAMRTQPKMTIDATIVNTNGPGQPFNPAFWVSDTLRVVLRHPLYSALTVRITAIEAVTSGKLRGVFEVIPPTYSAGYLPWSPV